MAKPDHELTDALFQLSFLLQARLTQIAAEHDLSVVQVRMFGILRGREPPGMLELARYMGLEKSSLSGLVDRAAKRGLVERIPSPDDRRAATIRVTARGLQLTRVVEAQLLAEVEQLVRPLATADRRRLVDLITQVLPRASV